MVAGCSRCPLQVSWENIRHLNLDPHQWRTHGEGLALAHPHHSQPCPPLVSSSESNFPQPFGKVANYREQMSLPAVGDTLA